MEPPDDLSDSEYLPDAATASTAAPAQPPALLKQSTLSFDQVPPSVYLPKLNPQQRQAVTAGAEGGLAVHAGPGSGKTAVLTTRVAHLIQVGRIPPEELVVVTFTNKAANEMKIRLSKLVGAQTVDKIVMGTFHSVCVRYLRKYAKLVNLAPNFLITDRDDCLAIIKRLISTLSVPDNLRREMKPPTWLESISKCKSRQIGPEQYRVEREAAGAVDPEKSEWVARVYEAYEEELAKSNALDFDDLLVRGYQLFKDHPRVVAKIKSVLIDEFQDTNSVQYDLVKLIAAASGSLTVVGDPDQSIYGWRNAEIENLEKMLKEFHPVKQIFLEENYRSTGAILGAALAVVRQDTKRVKKSLKTSHPSGSSVVLHPAPSAFDEATFIASTIKHLVAHLGGLVGFNDFAILLRYGALSRNIEVALQKAGVPSRMVGGHKFFDRTEIKDLLSYLQLLSNPSYSPALLRVLNVPRRGIGDKTQREIGNVAERKQVSAFEVCVRVANGQGLVQGLTGAQRKAIKGLVELVRDGRKRADEGADVVELIDFICDRVAYRQHLEKTQGPDANERWENIEELKAYATVVAEENPSTADLATAVEAEEGESQFEEVAIPTSSSNGIKAAPESDDDVIIVEPVDEDEDDEKIEVPLSSQAADAGQTTPLEIFLATSMLATDTETQAAKSDAQVEKVTISTCHAAKGLEWPVVFVPACEDGTYPFFRASEASEVDEERRLLYVAITRAQSFCFLSHAASRMAGADTKQKKLSPFLATASQTYPSLFVKKLQKVTQKTREQTAKVLGRPAPNEEKAKQLIDEYVATMPVGPPIYDISQTPVPGSRNYSTFGSSSGRYGGGGGGAYGSGGGFSSGRYGGASSQSQGRWSNSQVHQPQAVPAGEGGFRSALSTFKGAAPGTLAGGFGRPTTSVSVSGVTASGARSTAFKPPIKFNPTVPGSSSSSTAANARAPASSLAALAPPVVEPLPAHRPVDGPPRVTETRASMIPDAVLVNPALSAPKPVLSSSKDLLASFQKGAGDELDVFKRFGAEHEDKVEYPSAPGGGPPLSPKAKGKGKRAAPAPSTSRGKKAKQ